MVDLEFTPQGAKEPVHALDRVDLNSIPGLRDGAKVTVVYPVSNRRQARIDGGTRTYSQKAMTYILEVTFGAAALVAFVIWPLLQLPDKFLGRFLRSRAGSALNTTRAFEKLDRPPESDPRRKALESLLRSRQQ